MGEDQLRERLETVRERIAALEAVEPDPATVCKAGFGCRPERRWREQCVGVAGEGQSLEIGTVIAFRYPPAACC